MPETTTGYTFLDHTADTGVEIRAWSREELFGLAARALCDTVTDVSAVEAREEREVQLEATEEELLMVDFLQELLYLFETEELLFSEADVTFQEGGGGLALRARLRGEVYDEERHELRTLIKAVTYHGLEIRQDDDGGWRAQVIFDI